MAVTMRGTGLMRRVLVVLGPVVFLSSALWSSHGSFHWIAVVNATLKETLNGTRTFLSQHALSVAPPSSRRLAVQHEQAE
jgi:hypothetical protein